MDPKVLDELHMNLINARTQNSVIGDILETTIRRVERLIDEQDRELDQADYEHQQSAERSAQYAKEQ